MGAPSRNGISNAPLSVPIWTMSRSTTIRWKKSACSAGLSGVPSLRSARQNRTSVSASTPSSTPSQTPSTGPGGDTVKELLAKAENEFEAAQAAYDAGDLGGYQQHIEKARQYIKDALELENGGSSSSPSSTTGSSAPANPSAAPSP